MKIAIGCDPNAQSAKEELIEFIKSKNYGSVTDFGSEDTIYAHVATKLAEAVAEGSYDRGILIFILQREHVSVIMQILHVSVHLLLEINLEKNC